MTLPAPPRLQAVDSPAPDALRPPSRRPPLGALVAAVALLGAIALLAAALVGAPPFTATATATPPSASATASPRSSPAASLGPSASPLSGSEILDVIAGIERRMTEIRELSAAPSVTPKLVSSAEAGRLLVADFRSRNPPSVLADQDQLYRSLGLLRPDEDLGAVFERFLSTQVLGFYRSTDKSLYVISDQAFGPLQELTAAHEYTHALQDAHFGLDTVRISATDESDQALARLSLIEGDATLAMGDWAIQDLSPDELSQLLAQVQDPVAQQALAEAPAIVRETQTFPYSDGLQFVQRAWLDGGWASVDRVWAHPPDTTEQVLHAGKYAAHEPAIAVALPKDLAGRLGIGWSLALEDTQGELVTRVWLETATTPVNAAAAAAGWGGDRIGLYRGPNGAWAVAWFTRSDSAAEATEFATAAELVQAKLASAAVFVPGQAGVSSAGVTVLVASSDQVLAKLVVALGLGPD